jgi:hypothetical protein
MFRVKKVMNMSILSYLILGINHCKDLPILQCSHLTLIAEKGCDAPSEAGKKKHN